MHHNGLDHNKVISNWFTIKDNVDILKVFQEYDAKLMFSGHIHIQDITAESIKDEKIYDIASNALSVFPKQYGVLKNIRRNSLER